MIGKSKYGQKLIENKQILIRASKRNGQKKTTTIQATIRDSQKLFKKQKKPRTSTINETIATSAQGFKPKKKPTITKTMLATIAESQAQNATPIKQKVTKRTKKVAKKPVAKKAPAKKASKSKKGK